MKKIFLLLSMCAIVVAEVAAQGLTLPQPSPRSTLTQQVGLTTITVVYSRPSARKRTIFGKLVPYGELWRTGANRATTVAFDTDVMVAGQKLAAGKYALFTIPGETEWTIIFNKDAELSGTDGYKQEQDALRFTARANQRADYTETFTIEMNDIIANGLTYTARLALQWDLVQVNIPIAVDAASQVRKNIETATGGAWQPFAQAANYYADNNLEPEMALQMVNKSIMLQEHFWNFHIRSRLYAKTNDYKNAVADAEKSLKMAQEAKNDFYIQQNEANLKEWRTKVPATMPDKKKKS